MMRECTSTDDFMAGVDIARYKPFRYGWMIAAATTTETIYKVVSEKGPHHEQMQIAIEDGLPNCIVVP